MASDDTVICKECRNETSIHNVQYSEGGRNLVCLSCYQNEESSQEKSGGSRPSKEAYKCLKCNYEFSIRKDSNVKRRCPNCGKNNIARREELSASNILRKVEQKPEYPFSRSR